MRRTQAEFLEPVIERGSRFVDDFAKKYFQKASLDTVMEHLLEESALGEFPQLTGVVREQMLAFLEGFELGTPPRYPDAKVG